VRRPENHVQMVSLLAAFSSVRSKFQQLCLLRVSQELYTYIYGHFELFTLKITANVNRSCELCFVEIVSENEVAVCHVPCVVCRVPCAVCRVPCNPTQGK